MMLARGKNTAKMMPSIGYLVLLLWIIPVALQVLDLWYHPIGGLPAFPAPPIPIVQHFIYYQAGSFLLALFLLARMEQTRTLSKRLRNGLIALFAFTALVTAITANYGSIDLFYYISYGRELAVLGITPYVPLTGVRSDAIVSQIPDYWLDVPCVYGPTAVLFFSALNLVIPATLTALMAAFKLTWLYAFGALAYLSYGLFKQLSLPFTRWAALFGNPVIWFFCLRDAHLELIMMLFFVITVRLAQRQSWWKMSLALAMLCSIKATMLPLAPFFMWHAIMSGEKSGRTHRAWLAIAPFAVYMALLYSAFTGADIIALYHFVQAHQICPQTLSTTLNGLIYWLPLGLTPDELKQAVQIASSALLLAALGTLFIGVSLPKRPLPLMTVSATAMMMVVLASPYQMPWYVLWFALPLLMMPLNLRGVWLAAGFITYYSLNNDACASREFTQSIFVIGGAAYLIKYILKKIAADERIR
jgi:hypothetical protein